MSPINVIPEMAKIKLSTCPYLIFSYLGLSRLGFEHQTFCMQSKRSYWLRHRCGLMWNIKANALAVQKLLARVKFSKMVKLQGESHKYKIIELQNKKIIVY